MVITENKIFFASSIFGVTAKYSGDIYYYWFLLKEKSDKINRFHRKSKIFGIELKQVILKDFQNLEIHLSPKELISIFNQFCEPLFTIQRDLEKEFREIVKLKERGKG